MRILTFLHSFEPGGVERVALRLAGAWADAGHDVRVAMGRNEGPQGTIAPNNVIYDFAPPSSLARPFETFWLVWHLMRTIRRHRPDVLFCAGCTYIIVAGLVRLMMLGRCPPIVAKLSNSLERRDLPMPARAAYRMWLRCHPKIADRVVGMAPPMREEIQRCLNIESERIAIIPDPALNRDDLNALSVSTVSEAPGRTFVAVGRLTRQKNFALLIRAFARMAHANDRLVIIGEGPQRAKLHRLAVRLDIDARIEMPGHLPSVVQFLTSADVFVISSNYEGLPSVVVEALACAMPIVATDCSACMDYLLGYGRLGKLVPIRDIRALAKAMSEAPKRDDLPVPEMRKAAAQFTLERSAGIYLDVLAATAKSVKTMYCTDASASNQADNKDGEASVGQVTTQVAPNVIRGLADPSLQLVIDTKP